MDNDSGEIGICLSGICVYGLADGGDGGNDTAWDRGDRTDGQQEDIDPDQSVEPPEDMAQQDMVASDISSDTPVVIPDLPQDGSAEELVDLGAPEVDLWAPSDLGEEAGLEDSGPPDVPQDDLADVAVPDLWVEIISGPSPSFRGLETNVAIPEMDFVDIPILVDYETTISDLQVFLDITHTFPNELSISLISPAGTQVLLANNDDLTFPLVFDDQSYSQAGISRFTPIEALSAFNGESCAGTWSLRIGDTVMEDGGTVNMVWIEMGGPVAVGDDVMFLWEGGGTADRFWMGFDGDPDPSTDAILDLQSPWTGTDTLGLHEFLVQAGDGQNHSAVDGWAFTFSLMGDEIDGGDGGTADVADAGATDGDIILVGDVSAHDRAEAGTEDILVPDIVLPDLVILPDVMGPDAVEPDGGEDMTLPDIVLPDLTLSDSVLPDMTLSDSVLPDMISPDVVVSNPEVEIIRGPSRVYQSLPLALIPDGDMTGVQSTIMVDESDETITEIQVYLRIEHANVMDLDIILTPPATTGGANVALHYVGQLNPAGDPENLVVWYDDEGARPRPMTALAAALPPGSDIYGDWTLSVVDNVAGDSGSLVEWAIEFGPSTPVDPLPEFEWIGLGSADRYWWDSDAMPDVGDPSMPDTMTVWNAAAILGVLHTFYVIAGDGITTSAPDTRTFQFTDIF